MGISGSKQSASSSVFEKELKGINTIINSILNTDDTFKNKNYNFLSHDVCTNYQVVLENELSKHLKVQLTDFGSTLYLIPNNSMSNSKTKMTKSEICEKISSHYISILYIITLIKYIYDIENNGDKSFGGIIFRNIQIVDNMMKIIYCDTEQRDGNTRGNKHKMTLSTINGFKFFSQFFLDADESKLFMKLMRAILARKPKGQIRTLISEAAKTQNITKEELNMLHALYQRNYHEPFVYKKSPYDSSDSVKSPVTYNREIDTSVSIVKNNPVISKQFCPAIEEHSIYLNTKEGKMIKELYDEMYGRYRQNLERVNGILQSLVVKNGSEYVLRDIDSNKLNDIIQNTKVCVRRFYLQSILDFQHMLDTSKNIPHLKLNINQHGLF